MLIIYLDMCFVSLYKLRFSGAVQLLAPELAAGSMDLFAYCNSYSSFKLIIYGSTYSPGLVRRWCFPALADVVGTVVERFEGRYWAIVSPSSSHWQLLERGCTFASFVQLFSGADLSHPGRVLSFLGFVSFLLRNWPSNSVVPLSDRLDLICVPAWTKMQLWNQAARFYEDPPEAEAEEGVGNEEEEPFADLGAGGGSPSSDP